MNKTFTGGKNDCLPLMYGYKNKQKKHLKYKDPVNGLFQFMFIPRMMNFQVQE